MSAAAAVAPASVGVPAPNYRDFVRFRQQSNPCIAGLSAFLGTPRPLSPSQIYALDCGTDANGLSDVKQIRHANLASLLEFPPAGQGRVIVIQDIHPSIVETLGATLDIDPVFFAGHILTDYEDFEDSPAPPSSALLPSQTLAERDWLHIHYQQVVELGPHAPSQPAPWVFKTCANVPRAVRRLPKLQRRQLGIVRACYSILTQRQDQAWIGLVLVDSMTPELVSSPTSDPTPRLRIHRASLHGGFEGFQGPPSFSSFRTPDSPDSPVKTGWDPKTGHDSLLHQVLSLYSKQLGQQRITTGPLTLAYHPMRAILGEWMLYSHTLARYLKHYEYAANGGQTGLREDEMGDLQKWRHRVIQTMSKIDYTREFISYHYKAEPDTEAWEMLLRDLDHLSRKIERYGQSLERTIPVATSVLQLTYYRRSVVESVYIRRLTYMALVFVPLSWIAALFSMSGDFGPGQESFWVYFAVSVPFCFVVVTGALVLSKP